MKILYKNANIYTMVEEKLLKNNDILVEDKKIVKIGENLTDNADKIVNCKDLYAMPGIIESHFHLVSGDEHIYKAYIAYGITTARNMYGNQEGMGGEPTLDTAQIKKDIEDGKILAPTIINTSRLLDGWEPVYEAGRVCSTESATRYYIKEADREGCDQYKTYEYLKPEFFDIICDHAEKVGKKVVGHCPQPIKMEHFCRRAFSLEHTLNINPGEEQIVINSGINVCPTLIVCHRYHELFQRRHKQFLNKDEMRFIRKSQVSSWSMYAGIMYLSKDEPTFRNMKYKQALKTTKILHKGGTKISVGTDYPNPFIYPGVSMHVEMKILNRKCGMSPYEVMVAATVNGAIVCEATDRKGTLEVGKDADILFLRKDPRKAVGNMKKIAGVSIRGQYLDRAGLDQLIKEATINQDYV